MKIGKTGPQSQIYALWIYKDYIVFETILLSRSWNMKGWEWWTPNAIMIRTIKSIMRSTLSWRSSVNSWTTFSMHTWIVMQIKTSALPARLTSLFGPSSLVIFSWSCSNTVLYSSADVAVQNIKMQGVCPISFPGGKNSWNQLKFQLVWTVSTGVPIRFN